MNFYRILDIALPDTLAYKKQREALVHFVGKIVTCSGNSYHGFTLSYDGKTTKKKIFL